MKRQRKKVKIIILTLLSVVVIGIAFVLISNLIVVLQGKSKIVSEQEMKDFNADCIMVLGAAVWEDNKPSAMLTDRLDKALGLYKAGIAPKILVSGDHGKAEYDEVNVMKKYLIDAGVPSEDIFMDHAGFSTYESMYRAKSVFGVKKMIVVTQEYHLYRALYICGRLGIESRGAPSDPRSYRGALFRNIREFIARDKDIFSCLFKVKPTYLGDPIDIKGNGDVTNDQ